MIEVLPIQPVIPGGVNLGAQRSPSCVFQPSIGGRAFERISEINREKAVEAMALDLATAKSEIGLVDPIGIFKLKVRKAGFVNKATGKKEIGKTLVSPDFNNEPIQVWTDAGECGIGSKEEYLRITDRAKQLAGSKGDAVMFWVSPGESDSKKLTHRAYLWVKKGVDVTAYSYQLGGSEAALGGMMKNLGYKGEEAVERQTVFLKGPSSGIDSRKVFEAYSCALSLEERQLFKRHLERLKVEAGLSDDVLEQRIRGYQDEYEQELKEVKLDIEGALASIAYGFIALSRQKDGVLRQRQVSVLEETPVGVEHLVRIAKVYDGLDKKQIAIQDVHESPEKLSKEALFDVKTVLPAIAYGFVTFFHIKDCNLDNRDNSVEDTGFLSEDSGMRKDEIRTTSIDRKNEVKILEPIVSILIYLNLAVLDLTNDSLQENDFTDFSRQPEDDKQIPYQEAVEGEIYRDGISSNDAVGLTRRQKTLLEMIMFLYGREKSDGLHDEIRLRSGLTERKYPLSHTEEVFDVLYRKKDRVVYRLSKAGKKEADMSGNETYQEEEFVVAQIQKAFEIVFGASPLLSDDSKEDKVIQTETLEKGLLEDKVVELAKSIQKAFVVLLGKDRNKNEGAESNSLFISCESLATLSLLLQVYSSEDTSLQTKYFLAALIYFQVEKIQQNKELLGQFQALKKYSMVMSERFATITRRINSLLEGQSLARHMFCGYGQDFIREILIIIYSIARPEKTILLPVYTFERLTSLNNRNMKLLFKRKKSKKKSAIVKLPPFGIIFFYTKNL